MPQLGAIARRGLLARRYAGNQAPAHRKVVVARRQTPQAMQVVRQNHHGFNHEWMILPGQAKCFAQCINVLSKQVIAMTFGQICREKVSGAGDSGACAGSHAAMIAGIASQPTVLLVNARHVKNVSGRKSDVLDCQWLQQLTTYGLLRGAFRPADEVCVLRALSRQREMLLRAQARRVQHMQKALTQMNLQLTNVIADIVGETGQRILRAIVAGERDPHALAAMRHARIRASEGDIARSLQGTWRAEHLFALKQALAAFDFYATQLAECDREIEAQLHCLRTCDDEPAKGKKKCRPRNAPKIDLRTRLFQMCGVDLTRIDGINVYTMLTKGEQYTDQGQDYFEERYRARVLHHLAKRAGKMGMKLVASEQPV